ncbi:MAG: hypothetical protein AMS16_03900 [Planctomycetes bacterium DG_58]|nr:MAG: hypothetical protein AMS16_03900 [Planctomycetes bacterium DG_58]
MTGKRGKLRVAIVGAGSQANHVHYPTLAAIEDVEIVAMCDIDPERLHATGEKYGIEKRYGDDKDPKAYQKMIADVAPDAVYVIGQPNIMYDLWVWCLQQGLNLFTEKPPGVNLHAARNLARLAEKHDCITQVCFQRRICPIAVKLREECLKRGPIFHALCMFVKCDIQHYTPLRDRLIDDGIHAVDTLRWLCGGEVENVCAITQRIEVPDNNYAAAMIEFDNGAVGVLLTTWASGRRIFKVEMHSPGIWAEVELEGKGIVYADGDTKGVVYDTKEVSGSDEFRVLAGFEAKHREFLDCVREKRQPSSNFADAAKTMELAEMILAQSLLEGR